MGKIAAVSWLFSLNVKVNCCSIGTNRFPQFESWPLEILTAFTDDGRLVLFRDGRVDGNAGQQRRRRHQRRLVRLREASRAVRRRLQDAANRRRVSRRLRRRDAVDENVVGRLVVVRSRVLVVGRDRRIAGAVPLLGIRLFELQIRAMARLRRSRHGPLKEFKEYVRHCWPDC